MPTSPTRWWRPIVLALAVVGCADTRSTLPASSYGAQVANAWMDLIVSLVQAERLAPMVAARIYGYAGVTLYEAVVPGMPEHRSLGGQLNALPALPAIGTGDHDWSLVANAALAALARDLFASAGDPATLAAIDELEARVTQDRSAVFATVAARSARRGQEVADAILAWKQADGFVTWNNCPFTPPVGPGLWVPTPPAFARALQPCWGRLRTMALDRADRCDPGPPPAYSESPGSPFYDETREVYLTAAALSAEQRDIARYWADNPGTTGTPPGHWMRIVSNYTTDLGLPLDVATEAYARVGIAVNDAFIACWDTKFRYHLARPITVIRKLFDPAWVSVIPTPPFAEYTSGHSVQSGAAAELLTGMFGGVSFTDRTHVDLGFAPRSFPSWTAAAEEAAISRLYGGIHFRAAIDRGITQGQCIARDIANQVQFRR